MSVQTDRTSTFVYFGSDREVLFLLLEVQVCSHCNAKFFTTEQARKAEARIRMKVKWPIADTKKLIKEDAFE